MEVVDGFGDFKIEVICTLKYTDDFVLMAKKEKYHKV
jgi:hypothetical protein